MFTATAITMRKNPIYLSTYTGRPPDEPSILGEALNEVFVPLLKQQFRKSGRPAYFPMESKAEPLDVAFNRIPTTKRTDRNADTLIGELWDADGLWTVLIKPSKAERVLYAGSLLPAQAEIAYPGSKIAQYQRAQRPGEGPDEAMARGAADPGPRVRG